MRRVPPSSGGLVDVLDASPTVRMVSAASSGDFNAEFFFKRHHALDGVEAVRTEVVDEARTLSNLVGIDAQMLDNVFLTRSAVSLISETLDLVL